MDELTEHINNVVSMISLYGTPVQYIRYLSTIYSDPVRHLNPVKTYASSASIPVTLEIVKSRSVEGYIEGDMNVCMAGNIGFVPSIEDKIVYDSKTFAIHRITPYKIGTGVVYYEVMARLSK